MVIFVCTGNTCRSIMAESYLKTILNTPVESRGVFVMSRVVNDNAKQIIKENNLVEPSEPKQLKYEDTIDQLLLVMTKGHYEQIKKLNKEANVHLLSEYVGEKGDILDPFGRDIEVYRVVFEQLKEYLNKIEIP